MLYKQSYNTPFSQELFQNPTSEYRAAPFWSWNCKLDTEELRRQIRDLQEMKFGGFFMHVRTGMDTPYLSEEYMQIVQECVEEAKKRRMLAWLYDEDRWSSGAAGGIVTQDEQYRQKYLLFTPWSYEELGGMETPGGFLSQPLRNGKGTLLARYEIELDRQGCLAGYRLLQDGEQQRGDIWYAYLETAQPNPWYNNQTYSNTLDKRAVERFLEVTHERYKSRIGKEFGESVPAVFTDEPQFSRKHTLNFAGSKMDVTLPWTDDLEDTYREAYGSSLIEKLPELIWELPDQGVSVTRYRYHDHVAERFTSAFADTYGEWCRSNHLLLTGHLMEEPTLESQCAALGEAMRSYRGIDIPGVDMLRWDLEYTTVKQAQSMAHQCGREGVMSELYGVTGWTADFRDYKLHGDWQAALGVTLRVPHLSWVSMEGEAKRDFPATFGYQSPWYREFGYVEDHFARVNTALTRGKAVVRVGVIHPIESYWLHWGPSDQTADIRQQMDENFENVTEWLLFGGIDFDYICESQLPFQCPEGKAPLQVGEMSYDAVVVPECETLRASTLERLEKFRDQGGRLIFMGKCPRYMDAVVSDRPAALYDQADKAGQVIMFERQDLLAALDDFREVELREADGTRTKNLLYQLRMDGQEKWLFIARGTEPYNKDIPRKREIRLRIKGLYAPVLFNTQNGQEESIAFRHENNCTVIPYYFYDYDSLLLRLLPVESADNSAAENPVDGNRAVGMKADEYDGSGREERRLPVEALTSFTLSEPNVLVLDKAWFHLDEEDFSGEIELFRADNLCRKKLGWPRRGAALAQPWTIEKEVISHKLHLRFQVESEIAYESPYLGIEHPEQAQIVWNGEEVGACDAGWYVDRAIRRIPLPRLREGANILELTIPFGKRTNTEWCYLLGDFGVQVCGSRKRITAFPQQIGFDDITRQGLAFYGGAVTYRIRLCSGGGDLRVRIPHYRANVLHVRMDGQDFGALAYPPYEAELGRPAAGEHMLEITAYISRQNAFGALHQADSEDKWCGPDAWRTAGDAWTDSYRLAAAGLLSEPVVIESLV